MPCCETTPQFGCCPCLFGDDEQDYDGGYRTRDRYCTDFYVLLLYIVALVGLAVVVAVGYQDGDVRRLVHGTDYLGNLCGEPDPKNVSTGLFDKHGENWTSRKYLWYPWSPNLDFLDPTKPDGGVFQLLDNGVCVDECPQFTLGAKYPDPSDFLRFSVEDAFQIAQLDKVDTYSTPVGKEKPLHHMVWYDSTVVETFRRCVPTALVNHSAKLAVGLAERSEAISKVLEVNTFLERGMAELSNAWKACAIILPIAFVLSALWLFCMRFLTKPIVFVVLIGLLALMIGIGYICWVRYESLRDLRGNQTSAVDVYTDANGNDDVTGWWKQFAIGFWVAAGIYLLLVVFMIRRILIAVDIIEEAVVLVAKSPLLFLVPVAKVLLIAALLAGHFYSAILLYTVQDDSQFFPQVVDAYSQDMIDRTNQLGEQCRETSALAKSRVAPLYPPGGFSPVPAPVPGQPVPAPSAPQGTPTFVPVSAATQTPVPTAVVPRTATPAPRTVTPTPVPVPVTTKTPVPTVTALPTLIPKSADFCNATQYIERVTVMLRDVSGSDMRWYGGWWNFFMCLWNVAFIDALTYMIVAMYVCAWYFSSTNDAEKGASVLLAWGRTIRYHLGTVAFGAMIIAIIQFIRYVLSFFESKLQAMERQMSAAELMRKCVHCVLWIMEKVMVFVNHNAYIMTAIRGTSFCGSVCKGLGLIFSNFLTVAAISFITTAILIITKLAILLSCLAIGWYLLTQTDLAVSAEFRVFPLFVMGISTYVIASIWINIVDTSVQSLRICFMWDEAHSQAYSPADLKRWMEKHSYSSDTNKVRPEAQEGEPPQLKADP